MAVDLRGQIFQLRQSGVSQRGIARQLGISSSKVQRELGKRAPEVRAEREVGGEEMDFHPGVDVGLPPIPPGSSIDPLLAEEQAQLARESLQLRRAQIRSQRLEAERRAQLMEHPEAGQGNGLTALILQALDRQRDDTRTLLQQLLTRQAPAGGLSAASSLTEQMTQWRQVGDLVKSFAPTAPPSSAQDLEFKIAMEKVNVEERRIQHQQELEREERMERVASEKRRNEAVATAIEQWGPVLASAAKEWFEKRDPQQLPSLPPAESIQPRPVVLESPEVEGNCPRCGADLAITPGQDWPCPQCGQGLVAVEGKIRARLTNGELWSG